MNIPSESDWQEFKLFDLNENECVIYLIYDHEDKIIYIGRTQSFCHRMIVHKIDKKNAKKVRYFMAKQEISEKVESHLIRMYLPEMNKSKKPKEKIALERKKESPITIDDVRRFFKDNEVDISFLSKKTGHTERYFRGLINGTIELRKKASEKMRHIMNVYIKYWKLEKETNGEVTIEDLMKGE